MRNLICYICEKEINIDSKIAKVIPIKVTQKDGVGAQIEYLNDQEDVYSHLGCLRSGHVPIISCQAKIENFNQANSRIIKETDEILDSDKTENTDLLIRNDILNF